MQLRTLKKVRVVFVVASLEQKGHTVRKASFKVLNATAHSVRHNSRLDKPDYLIEVSEDFNENYYELIHSDEEFLDLAQKRYKETKKQKMQDSQIEALIKEVAPTLEEHHTVDDVKNLFKKLNSKYGGHYPLEISIHEDEGHFIDKDGITYYPRTDIFYKEDEKSWYIIPLEESINIKSDKPPLSKFTQKIDVNTLQKVKNRHAHVKFSMFDPKTGKTGRMSKGRSF